MKTRVSLNVQNSKLDGPQRVFSELSLFYSRVLASLCRCLNATVSTHVVRCYRTCAYKLEHEKIYADGLSINYIVPGESIRLLSAPHSGSPFAHYPDGSKSINAPATRVHSPDGLMTTATAASPINHAYAPSPSAVIGGIRR